ncbi:MAG: hypothetical protein H6R45_426 [Proteobacteria bacterium]|nr:hypothetical protein [Pseudomonadota bacterium]
MRRPGLRSTLIVLALLAACVAGWAFTRERHKEEDPLGLFTSLPIYWREAADLSAMLDPNGEPHWARRVIEERRELRPIDVLTPETLAPFRDLLLAQPRALAPAENVALDDWVRGGGHLLLFADPLLTEQSSFAIGDKRRPIDVALLSPILAHWGLELQFDDKQRPGEVARDVMGIAVPTNLGGSFLTQGQSNCELWDDGLAVTCAIGKGRAVAIADAAVLESADPNGARRHALEALLDTAFAVR